MEISVINNIITGAVYLPVWYKIYMLIYAGTIALLIFVLDSGDSSGQSGVEQDVKNIEEVLTTDVLSSDAFRKELQDIVIEQLMSCGDGGKLQPLTDLLTLHQRFGNGCEYLSQGTSQVNVVDI